MPLDPLQRRLEALENQLRVHEQERAKLADLVQQMSGVIESQRQANQHLEERLRMQRARLEAAEQEIQSIRNSRIWQALTGVAGAALRLTGHGSVSALPVAVYEKAAEREHARESDSVPFVPLPKPAQPPSPPGRSWEEALRSAASALAPLDGMPKISFLTPTWNTPPGWLAEAALSVFSQTEQQWEWCLVDDGSTDESCFALLELLAGLTPRIRVHKQTQNGGTSAATNVALAMATATFVACLDHDDVLAPEAAARCLALLGDGCDAVYTDSDKLDGDGRRTEPFHKPGWSPEFLRGVMYVGHLLVVRRDVARVIGGFRTEFDGVQDFDFLLRYSEQAPRIGHVSEILYHWRMSPGSVAAAGDAKGDKIGRRQVQAVQEQLERLGLRAKARRGGFPHRVRIEPLPRRSFPKISLIIPTKDAPDVLEKCLRSVFSLSTYPNFEVMLADNDTSDSEALEAMRRFPVQRVFLPGPFHFSRFNNRAARETDGEFLLFANNDIEVVSPDWLEQMLYYAEQPKTGAVGALLLYPDNTVQHAGVVLGCRGTADHVSRRAPVNCDGYAGSLSCAHEVSAVTAACLLVRRELFDQVGGFNELYATAYQDVDLCLRLRECGYANLFTPHAKLIHHESYSRGNFYDLTDRNLLLDQWEQEISSGDPYFNRHFDVQKADYTLA